MTPDRTATPPGAGAAAPDRYRLLVESITDYAIYMLDVSGRVASWNPGAERFKGYRAEEIIGEHFSRFYTEEDRARGLPAEVLRTAEREGRFQQEGWRVRKNGERFWAHVVVDPIRDPSSGALVGYAKITRDLTERRHAADALRRSEEQFRLLVEGVTDYAIYMLDAAGHVSSWNTGATRIKGYAAGEIIGEHFSRFYTPEEREEGVPAAGLTTARREGRWEREGWRVRKDGSRFWAHVVIDAIRDEAGAVIGFAKVTRDISERMEAQRALEKAREALFQAQKMEAIGQLTGGVAHDFNNLLMAVLGSLDLVRRRLPADPRTQQLLDNAVKAAQRGATLTKRLLSFARKQELHMEAVDIAALVGGIRDLLQGSAGPSVRVTVEIPPGLPPASTDPNQLETALLNLVVNARDAMPEGGPLVLSARAADKPAPDLPPGDYVVLCVADRGEGMDAETVARASEPFFTTKGVGKGTGLGLSTVHGLAAQSGGAMRILSEPGEGTTVELWLPVATGSGGATRPEPGTEPPSLPQRPLHVLAVDDDGLVLMNTAAMLEDLGHRVVEAASGPEALAALARHPDLDLVLTDQAMPQMSGLQLRARILEARPALPVIIATGYAELPSGTEVPRLSKPFTQDQLAAALAQALAAA